LAASSSLAARITGATGPKTSCAYAGMDGSTSASTVGL
jgi:hypothetical protein